MSATPYARALARLYALAPRGIRLDLDRVRRVSAMLGDPAARFPSVQIAGTNGKGSVAAMLDAVLRASGRCVGLYTSPHLHRFTERIRVDGREITHPEVTSGLAEIDALLGRRGAPELTFFEVTTLLALVHFARRGVDVAVVEVGLGGRLDATQLVSPAVSVITRIGLDHCDRLGDTLAQIAREKAGIVRAGVPVLTAASQPDVVDVIQARCRRLGAPLLRQGTAFEVTARVDGRLDVRGPTGPIVGIRAALSGHYQRENAGLAVATAQVLGQRGMPLSEADVRRGLARVRWPGRFEQIADRPDVILDVAHNGDGAAALARALAEVAAPASVELVFGVLADKDADAMLACLLPFARHVTFTRPPMSRARDPEELAARFGGEVIADVGQAVQEARRRAGRSGKVVVTGSIFTVGEARQALLGERLRVERPIAL